MERGTKETRDLLANVEWDDVEYIGIRGNWSGAIRDERAYGENNRTARINDEFT